jgi:hypothetical protein
VGIQINRNASGFVPAPAAEPKPTVRPAEAQTAQRIDNARSVFQAASTAPLARTSAPAAQDPLDAKSGTGFFKKVGNFFKGAAERVGDAVHSVVTGVTSTVVGAVKNVGEGIGTFAGGVGKVFSGDIGGGLKQMGSGLLKTFVQTPVDAVLMLGGRALSAVQTLIGVEPPGRKLTGDEEATLRKVYGDSIDYSAIRIKEGDAGLFSKSGRAFTHGNTIYIPPDNMPMSDELLVHETAHVWQHQNGGTDYMSEALFAQHFGDAYEFDKGLDEGKTWSQLDPEQQGEFLSQAQASGFFDNPGQRFIFNNKDYTDQLNAALAQVRNGQGAP